MEMFFRSSDTRTAMTANVSLGECDFGAVDAQGQWPGLGQGGK